MRIGKSRLHSLGSDGLVAVPEGVAACEIAVPPGPHINSAIDELATARVDENLMAMSSQCGGIQFYPRSPRISHSDTNWATVDLELGLGGVDSKDSLLGANQIQGFFLGGSLGCDGSFGVERCGMGANGAADHRAA